MRTVVLGWDLDRGTRWVPPYDLALTRLAVTGPVTAPWHVGSGPAPAPGTHVHLMLQGHTRGLVGRGIVRSAPFRAGASDRPGALGTHVLIEWVRLRLLPISERITPERVTHQVPSLNWANTYIDVLALPEGVGDELDRLWTSPHRCAVHAPGWGFDSPPRRGTCPGRHVIRALTAHR